MMMKSEQYGFTLIEVLVALVILAIAMMAITKVMQENIYATRHVKSKLAAHWVAMNVLSRLQVGLLKLPYPGSEEKGVSTQLMMRWLWIVKVNETIHGDYVRVSIDVKNTQSSYVWEHLIGFISIDKLAKTS